MQEDVIDTARAMELVRQLHKAQNDLRSVTAEMESLLAKAEPLRQRVQNLHEVCQHLRSALEWGATKETRAQLWQTVEPTAEAAAEVEQRAEAEALQETPDEPTYQPNGGKHKKRGGRDT